MLQFELLKVKLNILMSKYLLIIVGLAVIGGGVYMVTKDNVTAPVEPEASTVTLANTGTVGELMRMTGDLECQIAISGQSFSSEGEVFISGESFRGDFRSVLEGQSLESSVIKKEGFIYSWANVIPQGYKFAVVEAGLEETSNFDTTTPVNYECAPWAEVDASKFVLPADIEFLDGDNV